MAIGVTFPENEDVVTFWWKIERLVRVESKVDIYKKNWAIMLDIGWEKCTETLLRHGDFTKCSNMCDRGLMGGRKKRDVPPPPRCSYNYNFEGATKKNGHCTWKRPYHPPLKIGPGTPKAPIWNDFLHFHNCWSGAQTIRFYTFNPTAK